MFIRQLYHELYKMFARRRTYIGFGAFIAAQLTILGLLQLPKAKQAFSEMIEANGFLFDEYYGGLTLALLIIMFTFALLGALYLALVAGDIVAKEVEEGTMRMVLARPISRFRVLLLKWIGCWIYSFALVAFLALSALTMASIYRGGLGKLFVIIPELEVFEMFPDTGEGMYRYWRGILFLAFGALIIPSMALMFSCFRMKPAAATILTLSILFVDFVLHSIPYFESYKHFFITHHTSCWMVTFQDVVQWPRVVVSLFYLLGINLTCWIIGVMRFCTRDLKN